MGEISRKCSTKRGASLACFWKRGGGRSWRGSHALAGQGVQPGRNRAKHRLGEKLGPSPPGAFLEVRLKIIESVGWNSLKSYQVRVFYIRLTISGSLVRGRSIAIVVIVVYGGRRGRYLPTVWRRTENRKAEVEVACVRDYSQASKQQSEKKPVAGGVLLLFVGGCLN